MGKSFELLTLDWEEEAIFIKNLRDRFEKELLHKVEDIKVNGKAGVRLPNTSNISFSYVEGEALLVSLDMIGIAASTGSACTSGSLEPSYVLTAMGVDPVDAQGSLRFSFGYGNTEEEIEYAVAKIPEIVERLRNLSPLYRASAT
jgi:cysteine desulfurase